MSTVVSMLPLIILRPILLNMTSNNYTENFIDFINYFSCIECFMYQLTCLIRGIFSQGVYKGRENNDNISIDNKNV